MNVHWILVARNPNIRFFLLPMHQPSTPSLLGSNSILISLILRYDFHHLVFGFRVYTLVCCFFLYFAPSMRMLLIGLHVHLLYLSGDDCCGVQFVDLICYSVFQLTFVQKNTLFHLIIIIELSLSPQSSV